MTDGGKLILSLPYNGEPVVPFHLAAVLPEVDEVILTEARFTHSGRKKSRLYAGALDSHPKITVLTIDEFPTMTPEWLQRMPRKFMKQGTLPSWFRENHQRDYPREHLRRCYPQERLVVVFADADEIVKPSVLRMLRSMHDQLDYPVHLEMLCFYYNFHWVKKAPWVYPYVVNDRGLRAWTPQEMRHVLPPRRAVADAGWHLSYFFSIEGLVRKLESFAHEELNRADFKSKPYLQHCLEHGKDIGNRGDAEDLQRLDLDSEEVQRMLPAGFRTLQQQLEAMQTA